MRVAARHVAAGQGIEFLSDQRKCRCELPRCVNFFYFLFLFLISLLDLQERILAVAAAHSEEASKLRAFSRVRDTADGMDGIHVAGGSRIAGFTCKA